MKRRKRGIHLKSEMNVVPYIDVMLVLLIIFMVTAPMFVPGVINLPSIGRAAKSTTDVVAINITRDGNYSINQKNQTFTVTNLDSLVSKIKILMEDNMPIVVSADKDTKYDNVINVVDKLYAGGIKKVALVVKEKNV